jgi:LysM repeat protein
VASVCAAALAAAIAPWQAHEPPALLVGTVGEHVTAPGDSLRSLGARFGVAARVIASDNGLRHDADLQAGQVLRIDRRHIVPGRIATKPIVRLISAPPSPEARGSD